MTHMNITQLLDMPLQLCTIHKELNQESLELDCWLEDYNDVSQAELRDLVAAGHFDLAFSTDGEIHVWPNYAALDSIPEQYEGFKWACHSGMALDPIVASEVVH